jgi:predicted  nucleic acid-binding Zn-ribbon protein
MKPLWTETREDREKKIRDLLDAAMGLVTDVPVVDVQRKVEGLRKNIRELDDRIVKLREKQLIAPKDGVLPGYVTDTVDSLAKDIEDTKKRIEGNREEIAKAKGEIRRPSTRPASSSRPSRSTCCSTACFQAIWCGWWRCSIRPS